MCGQGRNAIRFAFWAFGLLKTGSRVVFYVASIILVEFSCCLVSSIGMSERNDLLYDN